MKFMQISYRPGPGDPSTRFSGISGILQSQALLGSSEDEPEADHAAAAGRAAAGSAESAKSLREPKWFESQSVCSF